MLRPVGLQFARLVDDLIPVVDIHDALGWALFEHRPDIAQACARLIQEHLIGPSPDYDRGFDVELVRTYMRQPAETPLV